MSIILITGPSGSGKDTLLRHARSHFPPEHLAFARRYITRPPDTNEDNFFVDDRAFACLQQSGFFLSTWQAHGNCYGISWHEYEKTTVLQEQNQQQTPLLCSVSRTAIADFERRFDRVITVLVSVSPVILAQRLSARARESEAEAATRLQRADLPVQARELIRFDNSAPLAESSGRFTMLLEQLLNNTQIRHPRHIRPIRH